jgi:acetoin utilization deacetylase AcuC-like enzyme/GNAT superfamily N-acetyltransferase
MRACAADYLFSPGYLAYDLGPNHPMRPERCHALADLLREAGLLRGRRIRVVKPDPATDAELHLIHDPTYVETVKALSTGHPDPASADPAGLGEGDTPAFPGMHEAAALIAGGTLAAARSVMRGDTLHAFNSGGGLHHAQRDRASGFCVYNDLAVAIAAVVQEYEAKVLYLDFDVHHGDGVQTAFYDDPRVLTVSFHETGRFLFPGTGAVLEMGTRAGMGFSVNVPLASFTEDGSWIASVESLVPALVERFRPDLIVSQHGCDGHVWDEQSHLCLTTRAFAAAAALVHKLAHQHCQGRWVATGGGGYDPVRVVPRAWALLWAEMAGRRLPQQLPAAWVERWAPRAAGAMPEAYLDPPQIVRETPRRRAIERENANTVARVRGMALSARLRRAYRPAGSWTSPALPSLPAGRTRRLELPRGPVLLRDRCPASVVRRMRVAEGMHAFARTPEREAQLLRRIAALPENNLVIAHTPEGEIVAELTLAPAEGRWFGIDWLYEAAIEVAAEWRGSGLGEALLRFAFAPKYVERLIVIALGLSWHWDLEAAHLTPLAYRDMLTRLFGSAGFEVYSTDDEEIRAGAGNVLLARVGRHVPHDLYDAFYSRLHQRLNWAGM